MQPSFLVLVRYHHVCTPRICIQDTLPFYHGMTITYNNVRLQFLTKFDIMYRDCVLDFCSLYVVVLLEKRASSLSSAKWH